MSTRNRRKPTRNPRQRKTGRRRYTAGEWFMVLLGAAVVILFAGIIITAILG